MKNFWFGCFSFPMFSLCVCFLSSICLCFCYFQNQIDSNKIRTETLNERKKAKKTEAYIWHQLVCSWKYLIELVPIDICCRPCELHVDAVNVFVLKVFVKILRNWCTFSARKQLTCHLIETRRTSNTRVIQFGIVNFPSTSQIGNDNTSANLMLGQIRVFVHLKISFQKRPVRTELKFHSYTISKFSVSMFRLEMLFGSFGTSLIDLHPHILFDRFARCHLKDNHPPEQQKLLLSQSGKPTGSKHTHRSMRSSINNNNN